MPFSDPCRFPWYSDDSSAFRAIPMALARKVTVPGRSTRTVTYYGPRVPGTDANAEPVSEFTERELLSLMLNSPGLLMLTDHIEGAANQTLGVPFSRWWCALELDRAFHAPRLSTVDPPKPGDFDLVMGPQADGGPLFDWLVGVEMKRMKFSFRGDHKMRMTKIDEAVVQARGYWELGIDQVLFAPLIVIQPERWSLELHGRERRDEIHDIAIKRLLHEIDARVPAEMGVLGLLYDVPPFTDPRENAELSIYKFRRPGVNPKLGDFQHNVNRMMLVEALQRFHSVAPGDRGSRVVRACMHKQCRRPVRVRAYDAWGCPACGRPWLEQ